MTTPTSSADGSTPSVHRQFVFQHGPTVTPNSRFVFRHGPTITLNPKFVFQYGPTVSRTPKFVFRHGSTVTLNPKFVFQHGSTVTKNRFDVILGRATVMDDRPLISTGVVPSQSPPGRRGFDRSIAVQARRRAGKPPRPIYQLPWLALPRRLLFRLRQRVNLLRNHGSAMDPRLDK